MTEFETKLLIDGQFVPGAAGKTFTVTSPLTGQAYAEVASAGAEDLDRAARAARRAFDKEAWPRLPPAERGRVLRAIADAIRGKLDLIAEVETRSGGKTIADSENEVAAAARVFDYYAGAMDKYFGETIPMGEGLLDFTLREPVGVVAQIVPWNFPFLAAAWKVAPALATGCTVILKPASYTPLTALLLGRIAVDAGVPAGVLNVLPGPGAALGEHIATHPLIDKIAFTGETRTGASLVKLSADGIKRVSLELGGKSPNIVFADADIAKAAAAAVRGGFGNAGQSCSARTRLLIERKIHDELIAAFVAATERFRVRRSPRSEDRDGAAGGKGPLAERQGPGRCRSCRRGARPLWRRPSGAMAGWLLFRANHHDASRQPHADCTRGDFRPGRGRHSLRERG